MSDEKAELEIKDEWNDEEKAKNGLAKSMIAVSAFTAYSHEWGGSSLKNMVLWLVRWPLFLLLNSLICHSNNDPLFPPP